MFCLLILKTIVSLHYNNKQIGIMKILNKIDLTKPNEKKYVTYFYHKNNKFVWEVTTNGTKCGISIMDDLGINKQMKISSNLPKYITNNL